MRGPLLLLPCLVALSLFAVACEEDAADGDTAGDTETEATGTEGIDREALLSEVEEVRNLFASQSALDAELIGDVSYEDGSLTVTLAEDASGEAAEDPAAEAEQICADLTEAIQLPDLDVTVNGADGSELASCQLE